MNILFQTIQCNNLGTGQIGITPLTLIKSGTIFYSFKHLTPSINTPFSFQITKDKYLRDPKIISKTNHSCDPNIIVNTANKTCIAIKDILPGEMLTYFYPSTEWDEMNRPFACLCGSKNCIKVVNGAKTISSVTLKKYFLNDFILDLLD